MTSHTPGPWGLMEHQDGYYALTPPDGRCSYFGKLPCQDAEDHANAALISAAPDLLALAYDFGQMLTGLDPYSVDDVAIMRDKIKTAIARAAAHPTPVF